MGWTHKLLLYYVIAFAILLLFSVILLSITHCPSSTKSRHGLNKFICKTKAVWKLDDRWTWHDWTGLISTWLHWFGVKRPKLLSIILIAVFELWDRQLGSKPPRKGSVILRNPRRFKLIIYIKYLLSHTFTMKCTFTENSLAPVAKRNSSSKVKETCIFLSVSKLCYQNNSQYKWCTQLLTEFHNDET